MNNSSCFHLWIVGVVVVRCHHHYRDLGVSHKVIYLHSWIYIIPQWISQPRIRKPNKHRKVSSDAGRFAHNLRTCKQSHYNIRNCKSGRHNRRHSFKRHRSRHKPIYTNIPYDGLTVKGRHKGITKPPSPRRRNRMLRAINHRPHITNHTFTQVDSNTNLLDKVILTEVVLRPTKTQEV